MRCVRQHICIPSVHVENFSNLRDRQLSLQPGLNVLVGRNNVGKSNLVGHPAQHGLSEVRALRTALQRIVKRAVAAKADSRKFPRSWLFHHRWGRAKDARTARGERIEFFEIGGRTTAWVPTRTKKE